MEHYHLKWNAHHEETFAEFESLLADEAFADVVLSCRGMAMRAHRLVLSACSSYFRQTLLELGRDFPHNQPVLFFRDTSPQLLSLLLTYMYQGEVEVPSDRLRDLMELADSLEIKGLRQTAPEAQQIGRTGSAINSSCSGSNVVSSNSGGNSNHLLQRQLQPQAKIWNPIADVDAKPSSQAAISLVTPTGSPTGGGCASSTTGASSPSPLNFSASESSSLGLLASAAVVSGNSTPPTPTHTMTSGSVKLSGSAKRKRLLPLSTSNNGRSNGKETNNNTMNGCDAVTRKAPELIPLEPPGSKIAALMNAPDYPGGEGTSGEDEEPENLTMSSSTRSLARDDRESSPGDDVKPLEMNASLGIDESTNAGLGDVSGVGSGGLPPDISPEYPVVFISSGLMRGRNKEGKTVHFCSECGYVSAHRGAVRRHLRTHTGEKPFQCDLCWRRFARKDHRNDHQVRCSGVQSLHRSAALLAAAAAAASAVTGGAAATATAAMHCADSPSAATEHSLSSQPPPETVGEVF